MRQRLACVALLTAVVFAGACQRVQEPVSDIKADGNSTGDFKGFLAIDAWLNQRLMVPNSGFSLQNFLNSGGFGGFFDPNNSLVSLLGVYVDAGGTTVYKNGTPNALNMALWQAAFTGLGDAIASQCDQVVPDSGASPSFSPFVPLTPAFTGTAKTLCAWPAASAKNEAAMKALWLAVMSFQAPETEYQAWRDWFLNQPAYANTNGHAVLRSMLVAIMMNPYFLLAQ